MKKNGWILVVNETNLPAEIGCVYPSFRDEQYILTGGMPPLKPESTGRVWVEKIGGAMSSEFFPGVLGMKWKEVV